MFLIKCVIIILLCVIIKVLTVSDSLKSHKHDIKKPLYSHILERLKSLVINKFNYYTLSRIITESYKHLKIKYKKSTKNQREDRKALELFRKTYQEIKDHNSYFENEKVSYRKAINKFADMEALKISHGLKVSDKMKKRRNLLLKIANNRSSKRDIVKAYNNNIPDDWDWREFGIVSPVKDQGLCHSCWAHTACATLESYFAKNDTFCNNKQSKLKDFSEQQLVDCSDGDCDGGVVQNALDYIKLNGLTDENTYPYMEADQNCNYKSATKVISCEGFIDFEPDNEELLKKILYLKGPIASAVYVTPNLIRYGSGIFSDSNCPLDKSDVNHAVTIVGYGKTNQTQYWIIKNSWGDFWGENGYFRLERNKNNMCGIASYPCYPNITGFCDTMESMFRNRSNLY